MMQHKASPGKAEPGLCRPKMLMRYTGGGGAGIAGVVRSGRRRGDPTAWGAKLACSLSLALSPTCPFSLSPHLHLVTDTIPSSLILN